MFQYHDNVPTEDEIGGSRQGILGDMGDLRNYGAANTFLRATRLQRVVETVKGKSIGFYAGVAATILMIVSFSILLYFIVENASTKSGDHAEKSMAVPQGKFDGDTVNRSRTNLAIVKANGGKSVPTTGVPEVKTTVGSSRPGGNAIKSSEIQAEITSPSPDGLLIQQKTMVNTLQLAQNETQMTFGTNITEPEKQRSSADGDSTLNNVNDKLIEMKLENGTVVPCEESVSTNYPQFRNYILPVKFMNAGMSNQDGSPFEDTKQIKEMELDRNIKRSRHQRSTKNRKRRKNKTTQAFTCSPSKEYNDTSGVCPACRFPNNLKLKKNQTLTENRISLLYQMEKQNVTFDIVHCTDGQKGISLQSFVGYVRFSRRCNRMIGPAYGRKGDKVKERLANLACEVLYHYPRNANVFVEPESEMQHHLLHCRESLNSLHNKYFSNTTERVATVAATDANAGSV